MGSDVASIELVGRIPPHTAIFFLSKIMESAMEAPKNASNTDVNTTYIGCGLTGQDSSISPFRHGWPSYNAGFSEYFIVLT